MEKQKIAIDVTCFNREIKSEVLKMFNVLGYTEFNHSSYLNDNLYTNFQLGLEPTDKIYVGSNKNGFEKWLISYDDLVKMIPFHLEMLEDRDIVVYRNTEMREVYKDVFLVKGEEQYFTMSVFADFNGDMTNKMDRDGDIVKVIRDGKLIFERDDNRIKILEQVKSLENEIERLKAML